MRLHLRSASIGSFKPLADFDWHWPKKIDRAVIDELGYLLRFHLCLALAADRRGLRFYHYDSICAVLERPLEAYFVARNALIANDLIAFDGSRFQVLSLPAAPVVTAPTPLTNPTDFADRKPTAIRQQILYSVGSSRDS